MNRILCLVAGLFLAVQVSYAAPSAKEFGTLPTVYDAAISPDGTHVAVYYNIDGSYGIRIISLNQKKGDARALLLGKGVKPRWLNWANNDYVLAGIWQSEETESRAEIGSSIKKKGVVYMATYLHTINVKTMKSNVLVKPKKLRRQFNDIVIDYLKDDPNHILMSFSEINAFAPDVKKVNVVTGETQKIETGREDIQYWYTDLTGTPRVGQGLKDRGTEQWHLQLKNIQTGKWDNYDTYPGLQADTNIIGFTSNPNEMIIRSYEGRDTQGLYIYDLQQRKLARRLFHDDKYDAQGVVLSADGTEVMGATFVSDGNQVKLFQDYETLLDDIRVKAPGYTIDYIDQSHDGNVILFKASSSYDPGMLMTADNKSGKLKPLLKYRDVLPSKDMGMVIPVEYPARDGFKIPAYVTIPPSITDTANIKKLPFIVLPHGGPYARDDKHFDYFAQFFASRGFGVLQMNFRGSAGYGKSFEDAGRKNWIIMQDDVEDGTRWLVKNGYADPSRVCIVGWSYGGYAALMASIRNPELYACSVSMAGVTDLQDMIQDIRKYRFGRISAQNFILKGFDSKDAINDNSPVKRAEEYTVPLFLAHGTKDQRVHFDQFKRMKRALKKSPAKVTYMEFEDEDHFLSNQKNRQKFFIGLDKFLKDTVGVSEHMKK